MKVAHATLIESVAKIGGNGRRHQCPRAGAFVQPLEQRLHPGRDLGIGRHAADRGEARHRHDAGQDRRGDPGSQRLVEKAEIGVGRIEELGDGPRCPRVELALQIVEIGPGARRLGVDLGIGRHRDLEVVTPLQPGDQFGGAGIALRMRHETPAIGWRRIAAKRHDMPHAGVPVLLGHLGDVGLAGGDTGEMRGGLQAGLAHDPRNGRMGAFTRRAARAIGHRHKGRIERRQLRDRLPQLFFHLLALGREKLEGHGDITGQSGEQRRGFGQSAGGRRGHGVVFPGTVRLGVVRLGVARGAASRRPVQILTVSG